MSTRDQLAKKQSELVPQGGSSVANVWNMQLGANPTNGVSFFITPHVYRMVSAGGEAWDTGSYYITYEANVSATMSAISCGINDACQADLIAVSAGVDAATAAGSRTDITLTADQAGQKIEAYLLSGTSTTIVFTETTRNTGGHTLPEGFVTYVTSAGNNAYVRDPAEATRLQVNHPTKRL